jgi:anti-anti-sigma factor
MTLTVPSLPSSLVTLPEASISLDPSQRNGVLRLRVSGDLDSASAPALARDLAVVWLDGWRAVLVDAGSMSIIDSAGLRLFVAADARVEAAGGLMAIARSCASVRRVFSASGHERLLGRERIAIALAYSDDGPEPAWSPFAPGLNNARSA